MRPKLLKSFIVVAIFWFALTTLAWMLAQPETNKRAFDSMAALMPFLHLKSPEQVTIFNAWRLQASVLYHWTLPVLAATAVLCLAGVGVVWHRAHGTSQTRAARESGHGSFRNSTSSKGLMPSPKMLPCDDLDLGSDDSGVLDKMTAKEKALLGQILGTLSAHPSAYAGPGVTVSLLEHGLSMADRALQHHRSPGLAAIVATSGLLGYITAFERKNEEWKPKGNKEMEKESARILATFDTWWALPEDDRGAALMAVRYFRNARMMPELAGNVQIYRKAMDLLAVADNAQAAAVVQEKQKTLESVELPDVIFDAFLRALPQLSFQSRGLPKGVSAVAWKVKKRVYLLEIRLRESIGQKLPPEVRGALTANPKDRVRVQPFTHELLKALDARGWLVRKLDATELQVKEALWNIQAGKLEFKGIIIIDVPDEFLSQLPRDDSMYEVKVTGTLFTPSAAAPGGSGGISPKDLDMLLTPTAKARPEPKAASDDHAV